MNKEFFQKLVSVGVLIILLVLSFLMLKQIILPIIIAIILAYLFYPVYRYLNKYIGSGNLTALLICIVLAAIIILPIWFLTPILIKQGFELFLSIQKIDFVTPLKAIFPDILGSEKFSQELGNIISDYLVKFSNSLTNQFSEIIRNFPIILLQLTIMFFTFFIVLRDQKEFIEYISSLLPFSKEVKDNLFKSSRDITISTVYGRIFLGFVQGILLSISFFIFGIPHALLLSLLAIIVGILPILGITIVLIPVLIYLIIHNQITAVIGVTFFGILALIVENFIQPILIAKWIKMNSALTLIGMIGGLLTFGVIGLLIGPLIIAYLLIILEIYRDKKIQGVFIPPLKS